MCFGKNYKAWMKAWYDVDDDFGAWFPRITLTDAKPRSGFGGSKSCSNTLSSDRTTITEINHDEGPYLSLQDDQPRFHKTRLVFGRINGTFEFLGVFEREMQFNTEHRTAIHKKIADGLDLNSFKLINK